MKTINVRFTKDKETKNTVRFTEATDTDTDEPKIGTIYIPKSTLNELNWDGRTVIEIELAV